MRFIYYPACNLVQQAERIKHFYPTPISWIDPRTTTDPDTFRNILGAMPHWYKQKIKLPPFINFFGDSGGFTVHSQGINLDPTEVIRWQIQECAVGPILDIPPKDLDHKPRLATTVINTQRALPIYQQARRDGTQFRWWGLLHGQTEEIKHEWYQRVAEVYPFTDEGEGWCLKPQPAGNILGIARSLGFAMRAGIKRVHILGITKLPWAASMFALAHMAGLELLTFDSTHAAFSGVCRLVFQPGTELTYIREIYDIDGKTTVEDWLREHCTCSSCNYMRIDFPHRLPRKPFIPPKPGGLMAHIDDHPEPEDLEEYTHDPLPDNINSYIGMRYCWHNVLMAQRNFTELFEEAARDPDYTLRQKLLSPVDVRDTGRGLYSQTMSAFEGKLQPITATRAITQTMLDHI